MNNRQELDKLVMTDPLAYAVYNKSKIENQSFEQFLISLVLTQHKLKVMADEMAAAVCDREKNLTQAVVKYLEASKELDNG